MCFRIKFLETFEKYILNCLKNVFHNDNFILKSWDKLRIFLTHSQFYFPENMRISKTIYYHFNTTENYENKLLKYKDGWG